MPERSFLYTKADDNAVELARTLHARKLIMTTDSNGIYMPGKMAVMIHGPTLWPPVAFATCIDICVKLSLRQNSSELLSTQGWSAVAGIQQISDHHIPFTLIGRAWETECPWSDRPKNKQSHALVGLMRLA